MNTKHYKVLDNLVEVPWANSALVEWLLGLIGAPLRCFLDHFDS